MRIVYCNIKGEEEEMGDLGYITTCFDCGKEFLCGEEEFSFPPSERVCYSCADKRLTYAKTVSYAYSDDMDPCLPYYD